MKWKTNISSKTENGEHVIRGIELDELIEKHSFVATTFLLLTGKLPTEAQEALFNKVLVSMVEHGVVVPSAYMPRVSVSAGNKLHTALAAGVLGIGDHHGGAIEGAAKLLARKESAHDIVAGALANKQRLPGFGHKFCKDVDPRAERLFEQARALGFEGNYEQKLRDIKQELETQSGKNLPINVDAATAACMAELGIDWRLGNALFVFARMTGMMAHAHEELLNEKPFSRRFTEDDIEPLG